MPMLATEVQAKNYYDLDNIILPLRGNREAVELDGQRSVAKERWICQDCSTWWRPCLCPSFGKAWARLNGMPLNSTWWVTLWLVCSYPAHEELSWHGAQPWYRFKRARFCSVWIRASDITSLWYCESMWPHTCYERSPFCPKAKLEFALKFPSRMAAWRNLAASDCGWEDLFLQLPVQSLVFHSFSLIQFIITLYLCKWRGWVDFSTHSNCQIDIKRYFWMWFQMLRFKLMCWFHIFFIFTPFSWANDPKLTYAYFSSGLVQPPTR